MTKLSFLAGSVTLFGRSARQNRADSYSMLNRYDDHVLKDIGLTADDLGILRRR